MVDKKLKIRVKRGWIAYPGSTLQQNYAEELKHGYLFWEIEDKHRFDVKFCELPNPKPFVTIDWAGDVTKTSKLAATYPVGSRFRVRSNEPLTQKDATGITAKLRDVVQATEVTFKVDQYFNRNTITTGNTTVTKTDLRNIDVIMKLLKQYHKTSQVNSTEWESVSELVNGYIQASGEDEVVRNAKWSLRHLRFDNILAYGEKNVINFDALNGVVGIFGPNRAGKSSIVGAIMYALFNGTDRGSMKNLHIVNVRKPFCYAKAIINVNGTDYVIERQTVKHENKRGVMHANTSLNVFRIDDGEAVDLAGEQRTDTEKVIKQLIGTADDFLLTSLSAQDEGKLFISHGSSRRRQILSKFLDLDVFDKMHDLAKVDANGIKSTLKNLPERDWTALEDECIIKLETCDRLIEEKDSKLVECQEKIVELRRELSVHNDVTPVTKTQVETQNERVNRATKLVADLVSKVSNGKDAIQRNVHRLATIEHLQSEHNIVELKKRLDAFKTLEATVVALRHSYEKEATVLKQQERALKILDDVPCGDEYPTCKFIKDAHLVKDKIEPQRERLEKALEKLTKAEDALVVVKREDIQDKITKVEGLNDMHTKLHVETSEKRTQQFQFETNLEAARAAAASAQERLTELEAALKNDENVEVVSMRAEIDRFQSMLKVLDNEKMDLATERGRVQSVMDKNVAERRQREEMLQRLKEFELVSHAFSRNGIPSVIVSSQLPIINAEVAKILHGIVDFTVELEAEDDSDVMELFINYGDSRRIIELGSGMEKMIASIALRAALTNISSLPKTDMFVIDEGFGALDGAAVEACQRLLTALRRNFKTIVVITHVDGIKDAADTVLEINKVEKDARVVYD